ncbi:membrane protein [Vreelandella aquamarina]|jgi:hypothetical protein|uniref:hypothetical protein n=1 Tax=Vreelandella aquamarina TaxID=77097 RepID=UPI0005CBC477|nr:hypothetical protein [Halomonas meridiana]KJD20525.1 membrane protein [Halomonas meridiana]
MRQFLLDTLGLAGFGALNYGLYLRFGLADALIYGGSLLLLLALAAARAAKRSAGDKERGA